jgi:hypothetical protein
MFTLPNRNDNPGLHRTKCRCGGTVDLIKYNNYGTSRVMEYTCIRCSRTQKWRCGATFEEH